jgi:sensor c-di-GMP phosphodiesterase-like protein
LLGFVVGVALSLMASRLADIRRFSFRNIRRSFDVGDLVLHYQPIVCAQSRQLYCVEVLLRVRGSNGILLSPEEYLNHARTLDRIPAVTRVIFEKVLYDIGNLLESAENFSVSINIDGDDLESSGFVEFLLDHPMFKDIDREKIRLEITETKPIDSQAALESARRIRRAGHMLSLDDFGTGYSSMSYLSILEVDIIKLDQSFAFSVGKNDLRSRLIEPIIDLAAQLRLPIVVEGIETEEQESYFQSLNVFGFQGWRYGRPMPSAEIIATIEQRANLAVPMHRVSG